MRYYFNEVQYQDIEDDDGINLLLSSGQIIKRDEGRMVTVTRSIKRITRFNNYGQPLGPNVHMNGCPAAPVPRLY